MDIEAIKQLKHSYFRCLDTANFEELSTVFHEDVQVHFVGGSYEWKLEGRDEYLASIQNAFHRESIGHHNGHHPEIQILDENEATGIWYLSDNMWVFNFNFFTTGTAIYWDRYVKRDGRWLIRETRYERILRDSTRAHRAAACTLDPLSGPSRSAAAASRGVSGVGSVVREARKGRGRPRALSPQGFSVRPGVLSRGGSRAEPWRPLVFMKPLWRFSGCCEVRFSMGV